MNIQNLINLLREPDQMLRYFVSLENRGIVLIAELDTSCVRNIIPV